MLWESLKVSFVLAKRTLSYCIAWWHYCVHDGQIYLIYPHEPLKLLSVVYKYKSVKLDVTEEAKKYIQFGYAPFTGVFWREKMGLPGNGALQVVHMKREKESGLMKPNKFTIH